MPDTPPRSSTAPLAKPSPHAHSVLDEAGLHRTLDRMAREIHERHPDSSSFHLIGIPSRGVELAARLGHLLSAPSGVAPFCGALDIAMHRDDIGRRGLLPRVEVSRLPADFSGSTVILVDDVLQSGRTCRAAMDALSSFGRPARIEYAVLIDRGLRELPIAADYVGRSVSAGREERVYVRLRESDGLEGVWVDAAVAAR